MLKKIINKLVTTVTGGAIIIGGASVLSKIIGLARDNLFAKIYGAGATLDVYNAAFKIPDFIFNIIVLGALSASFIPVFLDVLEKKGKKEAWQTANSVLNLLLAVLVIFVLIGFVFAPYIVQNIMMPDRPLYQQQETVNLLRVMLVSIIFFGCSNVFSGILNSFRRFLAFSLAPIFYNLGIIFGLLYLSKIFGSIGLAYGVVLGALLHFLIQLPAVLKIGWRYMPIFNFSLPGVKKILRLMPARSIALGIAQLNIFIIAILALKLEEGSLTIWTWADNLQNFPINVLGVSLAMSAFPVFSQAFASKNYEQFKISFSTSFRRVLFLIIPVSIITLLLRAQIVRMVLGSFGGGKFDWDATILVAQTLGFFSISMFSQACIPMLARSFFAQQDTKTPVIISLISMIINAVSAYFLSKWLGIYGLALGYSIANLLNMLMLLAALRIKFGNLDDERIVNSVWKIILASLAMGLIIHGTKYALSYIVDMHTFIGIFIQSAASVFAGGFIYLSIAVYFRFSEVDIISEWLLKAKKQILNNNGQK